MSADMTAQDTSPKLATASDYVELMKPRIMMLVVFTALAGLVAAVGVTGQSVNPVLATVTILAVALGSGAAGAINMWYDRDIDALMNRTKDRPIPAGRVAPEEALAFAIILSSLVSSLLVVYPQFLIHLERHRQVSIQSPLILRIL